MEINSGSAINQGLIGMQRSQVEMQRSAQQIAEVGNTQRDNPQANDLVEPMVNMNLQAKLFDANAQVVKTANETLGTLLDTKA